MPNHPKAIKFSQFKGINNVVSPESTPPEYLKKALNVNIDKTGGLSKRKGYTKIDTGSYSSIWTNDNNNLCLAVKNGNLVRINSDLTPSLIKSGVGSEPISFEEVDGVVYYTSSITTGIYDNGTLRSWGIDRNYLSPTLSQVAGTLPIGTYQVTYTFLRNDGIESGCGVASYITTTTTSGISFPIPTHPDPQILYARVYCSNQNGDVLYYNGYGTLGTTYTISSVDSDSNPLRMFNLDAAPTGDIVKYYNGRLYVASGNVLWYSEKYQYQHFILASNYIEFPSEILEVMPVEDGIWIGSDNIYLLSGQEPQEFKKVTKEIARVIKGTGSMVSGSYIHMENTPIG